MSQNLEETSTPTLKHTQVELDGVYTQAQAAGQSKFLLRAALHTDSKSPTTTEVQISFLPRPARHRTAGAEGTAAR
jgi:hypothetical protein